MATEVTMKELLEAGVHFGHQTRRWNPKMAPFIFAPRNGIHILDLGQTVDRLEVAAAFVRETTANGGEILFVGTKKQAQDVVQSEAQRAEMPFVINRWLGGTLTNWQTISARIEYMLRLEHQEEVGDWDALPKKEGLRHRDQLTKLHRYVGGLRDMNGLPAAMFIVDVPKEAIAVKEAQRLNIPIVAMCDTNCDPSGIPYPIPSNDDAIRAIRLIAGRIATAAAEGMAVRESLRVEARAQAGEPPQAPPPAPIVEASATPPAPVQA
ncbi:MAG: small subunit ribosomal protein S2 [Chloroflexi bacterium]|nr:MAG: small subunit ribosomal protein S2 [Chloroflexota bacterium]